MCSGEPVSIKRLWRLLGGYIVFNETLKLVNIDVLRFDYFACFLNLNFSFILVMLVSVVIIRTFLDL